SVQGSSAQWEGAGDGPFQFVLSARPFDSSFRWIPALESPFDIQPAMPDDLELDRLKLPPHSLEAEQSVLGGLLLDNEAADKVGDVITDADFYSDAHRLVYAHILRLVSDSKPADVVTVSESLAS